MFRIFKNEILLAALGLLVAVSCGQPGVKNGNCGKWLSLCIGYSSDSNNNNDVNDDLDTEMGKLYKDKQAQTFQDIINEIKSLHIFSHSKIIDQEEIHKINSINTTYKTIMKDIIVYPNNKEIEEKLRRQIFELRNRIYEKEIEQLEIIKELNKQFDTDNSKKTDVSNKFNDIKEQIAILITGTLTNHDNLKQSYNTLKKKVNEYKIRSSNG